MNGEGGASRTGIRRARPQLSCVPCRQGKLKCNRIHPTCDQCIKRSRESACIYLPPPPRLRQNQNLKGRLRHLENLVLDLIKDKSVQEAANSISSPSSQDRSHPSTEDSAVTSVTPPEPEETNVSAFGQMNISHAETSYVGSSHWSTILQEIKEVRNVVEDEDEEDQRVQDEEGERIYSGASITFGHPKYLSRKLLIEALPPKAEVDSLVAQWFNSQDPFIYAIHAPSFQQEYKVFWENKESTPIMWYGILYAILGVAVLMGHRALPGGRDIPVSLLQQTDHFQNLAASAMAIADISKPQPYALECLLIYTESQYLRWDNAHVKIWLMLGTAVRIALRMGCHRDSSHYPSLSVFQGEMRRRHWHLIYQMDVLVSFAIGLPSMIRTIESDTRPPHNLFDSDFNVDSTELPPERPLEQLTPALYTLSKCRLCKIFAAAAEASHAITPPPIAEILSLDEQLQDAHEAIAPPLKLRPLDQCIIDPPDLIMVRFNLELLYLKSRCVLHRRYLTSPEAVSSEQLELSRRICIESAMESLIHQATIFAACQPGGQLYNVRWYLNSLTTYDFLLASMIVCLELSRRQSLPSSDGIEWMPPSQQLVSIMEEVQGVWEQAGSRLKEAKRAASALKVMLERIKAQGHTSSTPAGGRVKTSHPFATAFQADDTHLIEQSDPGYSLKTVATGGDSTDEFLSFGNMLDVPMEFDWGTWDNHIRGPDAVPDRTFGLNYDAEGVEFLDDPDALYYNMQP